MLHVYRFAEHRLISCFFGLIMKSYQRFIRDSHSQFYSIIWGRSQQPLLSKAALEKMVFVESFNSKMCDELLNREIFYTIKEAKVFIEQWRQYYNTERPHSSLNYKAPVPQSYLLKAGLEMAVRY